MADQVAQLGIDVFTIFPRLIETFCAEGVVGRGVESGVLRISSHDLRMETTDTHRTVDDQPFGGGAGMVMKPEPLFAAVEKVGPRRPLLLLSPGGRIFDQTMAAELASEGGFSLLCGRYEGVDQRVIDHLADGEVSVGDVILAGGEVGAMMMIEATARLVPGVLGNSASIEDESFAAGLLEYPHYTRPADFRGWNAPEVLRSGDHARVRRWRLAASIDRTRRLRPDLIEARGGISEAESAILAEFDMEA